MIVKNSIRLGYLMAEGSNEAVFWHTDKDENNVLTIAGANLYITIPSEFTVEQAKERVAGFYSPTPFDRGNETKFIKL